MELSAWSPNGFRFFCMSSAMSILLVEILKGCVDLIPGEMVNFVVYNVYGFVCFCTCLWCGRTIKSRKTMWFVNGFMTSSVFMLWYATQFYVDQWIYPVVYFVELLVVLLISNKVRTYEHPDSFVELSKLRNTRTEVTI